MRHDLSDVPDVPAPEGITLTPVSASDPVRMGRTVKR
jgi:hypothetical protein